MRTTSSNALRLFGTSAAIAGTALLAGLFTTVSSDAGAAPMVKRFYESRGGVAGARSAKTNPLRVGLYAVGDRRVEVVLNNTSRKTLRIPYWQLPSAANVSNLFQVSRDGQPIRFEGAMVKRSAPTAEDFVVIRPGHSHRAVVDLSSLYDMTARGHYTVAFNAPLQFASLSGPERLKQANGAPMMAKSVPIQVLATTDAVVPTGGKPRPSAYGVVRGNSNTAFGLNVAYSGCTVDRQDLIGNAIIAARAYSENAKGYLNSNATGARYTSWFGAYASTRYTTAQQHFVNIDNALDQNNGQITINCVCAPNLVNAYAYVFSSLHYEIYVCNAFWAAPMTGTDSKAGTLIHEMSHFNIVAGTDDHVYGQSGANNLANTDPTQAVDNADNHEYFAENTPFQN